MNERLRLAKQLLKDDGVIFVSIDDAEQAYLKVLMDEIFGEENFVANLIWVNNFGGRSDEKYFASTHEYVITYSKNIEELKINSLKEKEKDNKWKFNFKTQLFEKELYDLQKGGGAETLNERPNMGYIVWWKKETDEFIIDNNINKKVITKNTTIADKDAIYNLNTQERQKLISDNFIPIIPNFKGNFLGCWRVGVEKINKLISENKIKVRNIKDNLKIFEYETSTKIPDFKILKPKTVISGNSFASLFDDLYWENNVFKEIDTSAGTKKLKSIGLNDLFNFPKPINLIKMLIDRSINKNARILDFFAGSGTTGHAVLELNKEDGGNRTYTLVTNNENNIAKNITYERLFRINNGIGTNGEEFKWAKDNEPYKSNLNVYNIKHQDVSIFNNQLSIDKLTNQLKSILIDFGIGEQYLKNLQEIDILNSLLALKPQIKDKDATN